LDDKKKQPTGSSGQHQKSSNPFQVFQMSNTTSSGFGRKEDLVERVMESIKTLSKKEEEVKVVAGGKIVTTKKSSGGGEVLNFKNNTNTPAAIVK
jgi:hypothetical protein